MFTGVAGAIPGVRMSPSPAVNSAACSLSSRRIRDLVQRKQLVDDGHYVKHQMNRMSNQFPVERHWPIQSGLRTRVYYILCRRHRTAHM